MRGYRCRSYYSRSAIFNRRKTCRYATGHVFFRNARDYEFVTGSGILSPQAIGRLYRVDPESVKYFQLPALHAVKISFPRPVTAGSFEDRDLHAGQQHVPLAALPLPDSAPQG